MDDDKMIGNAENLDTVEATQSAHCLMTWGHFSTKDQNVEGNTHKMLWAVVQNTS